MDAKLEKIKSLTERYNATQASLDRLKAEAKDLRENRDKVLEELLKLGGTVDQTEIEFKK